jgi:hypothetical protein
MERVWWEAAWWPTSSLRLRWLHGWTHYVSLGCFAVLVFGSLVLLFGAAGVGLYFVGPATGVLIIAGTRNTWELLMRARGARN